MTWQGWLVAVAAAFWLLAFVTNVLWMVRVRRWQRRLESVAVVLYDAVTFLARSAPAVDQALACTVCGAADRPLFWWRDCPERRLCALCYDAEQQHMTRRHA